jgi:hypothetical protein
MADNGRTQVMIAVIGLVSALGVALIANYDKVFPSKPPVQPAVQTPAAGTPASSTAPTPAADSRPAPIGTVGAIVKANELSVASIAGAWDDEDDSFHYVITQAGAGFTYAASENGADRGGGSGTVIGRKLFYSYRNGTLAGKCEATVADDGNHIGGSCRPDAGDPFSFRLRRQS